MKNILARMTNVKSAVFFTALFITVYVLSQVFNLKSLELESMDKVVFSQATSNGVSVKGRVNLFYNSLFAGIGLLIANLLILSFLFVRIKINEVQSRTFRIVSIIGISVVFISLMGIKTNTLVHFILLILIFKSVAYGLGNSGIRFLRPFKASVLSDLILILGFFVYFADLVLSGTESLILTYSIAIIIFTILFIVVAKLKKLSIRKLIHFLIPFSFVTLISFVAIELVVFHYLKGNNFIDYKALFLIISISAYLLFCIPFVFNRVRTLNSSSVIKYILAPFLLFGFTLLLFYFPIVNQNTEMFELANPANALMKIFQQHEIPFVDFISSHMFSEQWYGIIYSFIFGYNPNLDFQIYLFFNFFIYFLVVYFTLNKVLNRPAFSLLFIVSFPFLTSVFSAHLLITFIPFVLLFKAFEKQTVKRYLGYLALIVGLCIWQLDVGYAALFASLFYVLICLVFTKQIVHWKPLLKSSMILIAILAFLFFLAILIRDFKYIFENIQVALHYFSGDQAHGNTSIADSYPHQFYIIHFLIPFISVLLILFIIFRLSRDEFIENKQDQFILHSSLFLFLISLANAQRGLVRHGFAETNDTMLIVTFHLALSVLILYIFRTQAAKWQTSLFYVTIFLSFLLLKFFPFSPEFTLFDKAVHKNAFLELKSELVLKTKIVRTKPDTLFANEGIADFKRFLNENLTDKETFIDFSNTPMLYYYSNRKSPGYFCQNLQNTVDDYLQMSYIKDLGKNKVPVTVFSAVPQSWFDNTDGIPNVMRYYLITEHIYKNYKPFAIISNKRIWIEKGFNVSNSENIIKDTLSNQRAVFDYMKTAYYLYDFHKKNDFKDLEIVQDLNEIKEHRVSTQSVNYFPHHAYLLIELGSESEDKLITLSARDSLNREVDLFKFNLVDYKDNRYMLRISNSYHWHQGTVKSLQFENYSGHKLPEIKSIKLLKDKRYEN